MGILQHQLSVWKAHQHFGASAASLPFVLGLTCLAFYLILWRLNMEIRGGSSAVTRRVGQNVSLQPCTSMTFPFRWRLGRVLPRDDHRRRVDDRRRWCVG